MNTLRMALAAALLAGVAFAATSAHASEIRITQVADRYPDLAVFLADDEATAALAAGIAPEAAMGSTPLRIKSAVPWSPTAAVALVIAIDVSESIGKDTLDALTTDVDALLRGLPAHSQVALVTIGAQVVNVVPFGAAATIVAPLRQLKPDSPETALYEGMVAAQQQAARAGTDVPLRRAVLVLTDGLDDNRRGFGAEEAVEKVVPGDVPVFVVAVAPQSVSVRRRAAIQAVARVARASGGDLVQATTSDAGRALDTLMKKVLNARVLTIDCTHCPRDGVARTLQVSIRRRGAMVADERFVRLLVPVPAVLPVRAPAAKPSAVEETASTPLWKWGVAGAFIVLAAIAAVLGAKSKRRRGTASTATSEEPTRFGERGSILAEPGAPGSHAGPADGGEGRFVTLDVAGRGRMKLRVSRKDLVFGRSKRADVAVEHDDEASNRHACVYANGSAVMLRDMGSTNGTYLNGTRIVRPEPIQDRDLVRVGRTEIRVYLGAT